MLKTLFFLVGRAGIEPAANGLKVRCSTSELTAHLWIIFERALLTASFYRVKKKLRNRYWSFTMKINHGKDLPRLLFPRGPGPRTQDLYSRRPALPAAVNIYGHWWEDRSCSWL
jgi:hypothetical protein